MDSLNKRLGYLQGLLEGIPENEQSTVNGKIMRGIVDLLGELTDRANEVDEMLSELNDYVESIDDDLSELEGEKDNREYDDDYDEDDGYSDDKLRLLKTDSSDDVSLAGSVCPECGGLFFVEHGDDVPYICPHCGKKVMVLPLDAENAPIGQPAGDNE